MCERGKVILVDVIVPAHRSRTGKARRTFASIDQCLAPLVAALNRGGVFTVASYCGHGKRPGNIALADGRELVVCADFETARQVEGAFPPLVDAEPSEESS